MRFDRTRATWRVGIFFGAMRGAMHSVVHGFVHGFVLGVVLGVVLAVSLSLNACTENEAAVRIDEPPADSVVFWPSTLKYAKYGDSLHVHICGLKRRVVCAQIMELGWNFNRDTTGAEYYQAHSRFEIPGGSSCASDPVGLDTMYRVRFYTGLGKKLYLETPEGQATDSILFIADETARASAVVFKYVAGAGDTTVNGRFTFRDSTAARPRRIVVAQSLATCEIIQAAVYEKRQDTVVVKLRLIQATPRPASVFAPCAGPRIDSIEVVPNTFNFLPGA